MQGEVQELKELELWQVAEFKILQKEHFEFWNRVLSFETEETEELEDVETDFLKQLLQSAPLSWKRNINAGNTLRTYNRFKKALFSVYQERKKGIIMTEEKIGELRYPKIEVTKDGDIVTTIGTKEIKRKKIVDFRRKFLELLCRITTDSEEQYILLYYYCWKDYRNLVIAPHETIHQVIRKREKKEKVKKIIELRKEGKTVKEIAKELGLKERTVKTVLQKHKVVKTEKRDQKIIELRKQGKTIKEIAKIVGVSESTVKRVLKKHADKL